MSELLAFIQLGFRHIVNPEAADHILFLLALAAIYRPRDWRKALWVVTAFTVGHSITLALAVTNALTLPTAWIEFLIPVTIIATGVENLVVQGSNSLRSGRYRPLLSGVFGLVHGAGFANYLHSLFVTRVAVPLFGFNVGIELGQMLVLAAAALAFVAIDRGLELLGPRWSAGTALRWRVVTISVAVIAVATRWAAQRAPR
jgi:hypothetical protein